MDIANFVNPLGQVSLNGQAGWVFSGVGWAKVKIWSGSQKFGPSFKQI
jgi:hypothetical protein